MTVSMTTQGAQKKREQRARREAGIRSVQLRIHSEGWPELLVLHGCLAESDMEDWTATVAALELFLEQVRSGNRTIAVILHDRQTAHRRKMTTPEYCRQMTFSSAFAREGPMTGKGRKVAAGNVRTVVAKDPTQQTGDIETHWRLGVRRLEQHAPPIKPSIRFGSVPLTSRRSIDN
jgi:hypothetical protein